MSQLSVTILALMCSIKEPVRQCKIHLPEHTKNQLDKCIHGVLRTMPKDQEVLFDMNITNRYNDKA